MVICIRPASGVISFDSGIKASASPPDQSNSCGLRPIRSDKAPKGYCRSVKTAVPMVRATNTVWPEMCWIPSA